MLIRAFVPAHITAFFVPVFHEDPLKSGSLGAGVNLSKGTNVFLSVETGTSRRHIHIAFNGEPVKVEEAIISHSVAEELIPMDFMGGVEVWQYFDFPNGYGFGNSAGGALGTGLVLGYYFRSKTFLQVAQIAHKQEVINKGGLGDVIAQVHGGIEIRIKAGAPGIGVVDNMFFEDYKVLAIPLGGLSTREVLDSDVIKAIKREGQKALERLLKNPTPQNLMHLARDFAENTGLLDGELLEIAREIDKLTKLPSSMVMLGKSLFALLRDDELPKIQEKLRDLGIDSYHICEIYNEKPKVGRWIG